MVEKIFQKVLDKKHPERDLEAVKLGKKIFTVAHDCSSSLSYSLKGTHTYEEVEKINALTAYSVRYGYCPKKGPIAVIGIPNPNANWSYFREIGAYGEIPNYEEFEFKEYSKEDAKHIGNYTVYGKEGINEIADLVKFDKISQILDSRHIDAKFEHAPRVLKMKCKLEGKFNFEEAKIFARDQQRWSVDRGISFATLENGQHVAIMSFWYAKKDEATGFRDVWESGKTEPTIQKITFMTDEEASKVKDFSIYMFDYDFFYKPENAVRVEKIDRTFEPGFDFYNTPNGKDLRLSNQF